MNKYAFMSGYLCKEADSTELLKSTLRRALGHGAIGGVYGSLRGKDEGESRTGAIARSGARGAGFGAGATLGQELARNIVPQGASSNAKAIAQLLGIAGGGIAGYEGARALTPVEKPVKRQKPREDQMLALTKKLKRKAV